MIKLNSKTTVNLNKKEIYKICKLKNVEWKYGINSQIKWFKKNIKSKDIHNLFWMNNNLYGYTCLRKRTCLINKKRRNYFLFDTLIIDKKIRNKGLGNLLMIFNNNIIIQNKLFAFLICRQKTINFYEKNNWIRIFKNDYIINDNLYPNQYGMIFNSKYKKGNNYNFWVNK